MNKELKEKLRTIANHYGYANQKEQTVEEMAELMVALNKFSRYGSFQRERRLNEIITELADVKIMTNQLSYLLDCEDLVDKEIEYKVNRTLRTIEKERTKK